MKSIALLIFLASLSFAEMSPSAASEPQYTITIQNSVISLSKDKALRFLAQHHLESDAAQGFLDLVSMVEKGTAKSVANTSVTTKSGQRAINSSDTIKLEVEPVLSPSIELVDTTLMFTAGAIKIGTSFTAKSGAAKFLGSYDAPDAATEVTYLVFVRVSVSKGD